MNFSLTFRQSHDYILARRPAILPGLWNFIQFLQAKSGNLKSDQNASCNIIFLYLLTYVQYSLLALYKAFESVLRISQLNK